MVINFIYSFYLQNIILWDFHNNSGMSIKTNKQHTNQQQRNYHILNAYKTSRLILHLFMYYHLSSQQYHEIGTLLLFYNWKSGISENKMIFSRPQSYSWDLTFMTKLMLILQEHIYSVYTCPKCIQIWIGRGVCISQTCNLSMISHTSTSHPCSISHCLSLGTNLSASGNVWAHWEASIPHPHLPWTSVHLLVYLFDCF